MTTYYAICSVNGPISVRLQAETEAEAAEEFAAADSRAWIDECRVDAEDDLGICADGMTEAEFDSALMATGAEPALDLNEVVNAHAGTVAHVADGWYLWSYTMRYTYRVVDGRAGSGNPEWGYPDEWPSTIPAASPDDALSELIAMVREQADNCGEYNDGDGITCYIYHNEGTESKTIAL